MATVKLSGLISSIKGSIGGNTYQRSASGVTVRSKPVPLKSKTNSQTTIRLIQAQLNVTWLNMSDQQRATWKAFADFSNGVGLTNKYNTSANTGKMHFLTVNTWIVLYGKPVLIVPTFATPLQSFVPCPPYYDYTDNLMNYDGNLDTSSQILVTRVSSPQSMATSTANTGFRTLVYNQVDGSQQSWSSAYLDVFGRALVYGRKYWIELQVVDYITGAISAPARKLVAYDVVPNPLVLVVDTTKSGSASNRFILPCFNIGTYDATIDWGDGVTSSVTSWNSLDLRHDYALPGVYTISITGQLPSIYFDNTGDRFKLVDILRWGSWNPLYVFRAFYGCQNLVGNWSDTLALNSNLVISSMFRDCYVLTGNLDAINFGRPTQAANSFIDCDLNMSTLASLDTSQVSTFNMMFYGKANFKIDMRSWNIGALTTAINFMFGTSMPTAIYDQVLINWAAQSKQSNVTINFGSSVYTIAVSGAARSVLTSAPYNWTIIDGGGI